MTDVWRMMCALPFVEEGRSFHTAVVSHAAILGRMTRDREGRNGNGDGFGNAEFKTYVFGEEWEDACVERVRREAEPNDGDELEWGWGEGKEKGKRTLLIETEESKNRDFEEMCEKDFEDMPWSIKKVSEES